MKILEQSGLVRSRISRRIERIAAAEVSEDALVSEIIRSRWQLIGTNEDAIQGGQDLKNAYQAWTRSGRPKITPEVLSSVIDPHLNSRMRIHSAVDITLPIHTQAFQLEKLGLVGVGINRRIEVQVDYWIRTGISAGIDRSAETIENIAVSEIIKSRWQMIGRNRDVVRGGLDLSGAFQAWISHGRPPITREVLSSVIDPQIPQAGLSD